MVESCVKEVLQAVSRSLHVKRNVEFIFSGIGCLSIRDARVKMKFFKEFVKSMDNTGELVNALRNVSKKTCTCAVIVVSSASRVKSSGNRHSKMHGHLKNEDDPLDSGPSLER